jgi:hypothetical protein
LCPDDPNKTAPGLCGCGVSDADTDGDGIPDCFDQIIDQLPGGISINICGNVGCGAGAMSAMALAIVSLIGMRRGRRSRHR